MLHIDYCGYAATTSRRDITSLGDITSRITRDLSYANQLATLDLLAIHIEGHEVHALWQRTWTPSVAVLAEGIGSSICIYGHTCHVGKYQSYLVRTCLSYHLWDIHLRGEWVRTW